VNLRSDPRDLLSRALAEHRGTLDALAGAAAGPLSDATLAVIAALRAGGKILVFGNGGSAADAQHFAAELSGRYRGDRVPLAGLALTTDTSALTAIANDYGYDEVFARQVRALARPGDVAIGISTSGNSESVCRALAAAGAIGAATIAFGGGSGGRMAELADHVVLVPSTTTARIQEGHALMFHVICDAIEEEFGVESR
jgi:D-sedoheptulose 7-phosphate isomerase